MTTGVFRMEVARGWKGIAELIGGCSLTLAKDLARRYGLPVRMESGTPTLDTAEYLAWRRNLRLWRSGDERAREAAVRADVGRSP